MVSLLRQAISLAIYILRGPEETIVFYFHLSHLVLKDGQQQNVCQIMSKNVRNSIFIFLIWLSCWPVTESVSPTLRKPNSATCIFCVKKNIKIHKPNKSQWNMIQNHHNVQLSMIRQMLFFQTFVAVNVFLWSLQGLNPWNIYISNRLTSLQILSQMSDTLDSLCSIVKRCFFLTLTCYDTSSVYDIR